MKGGSKAWVALAGVAAVAGLLWWLHGSGTTPALPGPDQDGEAVPRVQPVAPVGGASPAAGGTGAANPVPAADGPESPAAGRTFAIHGLVRDGGGRPIAGAAVEARDAAMDLRNIDFFFILGLVTDDTPPLARATTDGDGLFTLKRVPGGRVLLRARAAGYAQGFTAPLSPRLQPPDHLEEIVLGLGLPVQGRVFLAGGAPVEGATLRVLPEVDEPILLLHRTDAVTDAEGRFVFEALPPGRYITFVTIPGRAARVFDGIRVPSEGPVAIEIPAGGSLSVAVRGPGGAPVEGASVLGISGEREGSFARGTTDAAGRAMLGGMDPGKVKGIIVSRTGFVSFAGMDGPRGPGDEYPAIVAGETSQYAVDLRRGAAVHGKVLDAGTGKPVAAAVVRSSGDSGGILEGSSHCESGPDGSYRLEAVGEGKQTLLVQASGFAPTGPGPKESADGDRFSVMVGAGGEVEKDLRIDRAASVSGIVTTPDGAPAPFAAVRVVGDQDFFKDTPFLAEGMEGFTDGEGRFRLEGLVPGKAARVQASLGGLLPATSGELKVAAGQTLEGLTLRLGAGSVVQGIVRSNDGHPLAGAIVASNPVVEVQGRRQEPGPGTRADEAGKFVLRGIAPGKHFVAAMAPGFVPGGQEVEVAEGSPASAEFVLEPAASVAGRVTDEAGVPVPGATIKLEADMARGTETGPWSARSGADGTFEVRDLPARGTYSLRASADGFLPGERRGVQPGARNAGVVLPSGAALSGRVLDEEGQPVAGMGIQLRRDPAGQVGWQRTGDDGSFEFRGLTEGEFVLRPTDPGGNPDLVLEDSRKVPSGTHGMEFRLRRGLPVSGRVVDGEGRGVEQVFLTVQPAGKGVTKQARSDTGGAFTIHGLPPGPCVLRASQAGILDARMDDVAAGSVDVVVRVQIGLVLAGTVTGPDGKPLGRDVQVMLRRQGRQTTVSTDEEGRFRFDGLPKGDVEVGAWKPREGQDTPGEPDSGWVLLRAGDEGARISMP